MCRQIKAPFQNFMSPSYIVDQPLSNASDIHLKPETKATIIEFTIACSCAKMD